MVDMSLSHCICGVVPETLNFYFGHVGLGIVSAHLFILRMLSCLCQLDPWSCSYKLFFKNPSRQILASEGGARRPVGPSLSFSGVHHILQHVNDALCVGGAVELDLL